MFPVVGHSEDPIASFYGVVETFDVIKIALDQLCPCIF
jgi:hypothetical protein